MNRKRRGRDKEISDTKISVKGGSPKKREPGTGKGQILSIADDFDKPLDDFGEYD